MGYAVFNRTDGVPAGFYEWDTEQEAQECIDKMRNTFKQVQGYYKTATGVRIDPDDVEYEIVKTEEDGVQ